MDDRGRHIRVVVVDDEPDLRLILARQLARAGFTVVGEASDIASALAAAEESNPDVVLLDLMLGTEHGREAIGPLMRICPDTMVAVLTALPAEQEESPLRQAGAFTYYEKSMISELPTHLTEDLALFRRALTGEDVLAPSAMERRPAAS
jgi:DNA-binding response OmpR family regulator